MITGNYNARKAADGNGMIIPYQVITGNYNVTDMMKDLAEIIPYQVITGNYNNHGIKITS